ncbi:MAG: hypothetical protein R3B40_19895 [Polyangiales bacterium]|nr:hypothetical protein [Myxococcales bacterium]MCB9659401.1 hypothetical protein [Sandaracinaceae bacterium]
MLRRDILAWSAGALGAAALSSLSPRTARAGACAEPGFMPVYRTAAGARLGRTGAVLLGVDMSFGGGTREPFAGRYSMTVDDAPVRVHASPLAPGLVRLIPNRFVAGAGVVTGPAGELRVTWVDAQEAAPAPCFVRSVEMYRNEGSQEPYSPPTWGLRATLRDPLPGSVVGVVVAPAASGSRYGLFAERSGDRMQGLYHSPGRCQAELSDVNPPGTGSRVRLACVGQDGQVSVRSNDVAVRD